MSTIPTTITALDMDSAGVWWVHTKSGAVHIWDFDNQTVTRARPDDHTGMRWDGSAIPLVHVAEYPRVGSVFGVVLDTPGVEGMVTIRTSSDVVSIQRPPR